MAAKVLLVCGLPKAGKSHIIRLLAEQLACHPPWYVRLAPEGVAGEQATPTTKADLFAGSQTAYYAHDRVSKALPNVLAGIADQHPDAIVLVEAESATPLRYAFPYDYRLFVTPAPSDIHEVFRTTEQASAAMQQVMQDAGAFAAEVFSLIDAQDQAEAPALADPRCPFWAPDQADQVSSAQLDRFLATPIGAEVATRIQLQPAFHGLIEADIVVINGDGAASARECQRRIQALLTRLQCVGQRQTTLYRCDPANRNDPRCQELRAHIGEMASHCTRPSLNHTPPASKLA